MSCSTAFFLHFLIKDTIFEKVIEYELACFELLYNSVWLTYFILKNIQRDIIINVRRFPRKSPFIFVKF